MDAASLLSNQVSWSFLNMIFKLSFVYDSDFKWNVKEKIRWGNEEKTAVCIPLHFSYLNERKTCKIETMSAERLDRKRTIRDTYKEQCNTFHYPVLDSL